MTSSYSEKITKVKNALENVFVKKTDIQNNLTSTDTNKPLSANQGKILDTNKVDKISGKSLSTNDFTNTYKTKLDNLDTLLESKANNVHTHGNLQNDGSIGTSNNVNKNVITDGNGKITTEDKPVIPDVSGKIDTAGTGLSKSGTTLNHSNSITTQNSTVFKKISYDEQGHITGTVDVTSSDLPSHTHATTAINNSETYTNLGSNLTTQKLINDAINSKIGELGSGGTDLELNLVPKSQNPNGIVCISGGNVNYDLDKVYPIGSIYMSVNSANPSTLFGGTWVQLTDTFLYATSTTSDANSTTATDGEATHTLTINEMPSHNHRQYYKYRSTTGSSSTFGGTQNSNEVDRYTDNTGGGQAHNNMPPYMKVYMWKRTA